MACALQRGIYLGGVGHQTFRIGYRKTIDQAAAINDFYAALRDKFERQRVDAVFGLEHTSGEGFLAVARMHTDRALQDNGPGIHFRDYEMHGGAVAFDSGFKRALVSIETLERRQ
jgi:hypothetical protein